MVSKQPKSSSFNLLRVAEKNAGVISYKVRRGREREASEDSEQAVEEREGHADEHRQCCTYIFNFTLELNLL